MPVYPPDQKTDYGQLLSYAAIMDGLSGQSIQEDAFASFYFSMDYVLLNRYILSFTTRTDGSNNFGKDEQFSPTGSLGLGWNVGQESFMQALKPTVSSLTLRAAFGYTGNINKSVYPQLVMDYLNQFRRTGEGAYRLGYIKNAPNPHLRWEKTRDMKLSVDLGLFNERLHLSGEIYDRRTRDAVSQVDVPYTTGFSTQSYNTSELLNQGAEVSLNARLIESKDWRLSLSANLAYNRNKLLRYDTPNPSIFQSNYVGYPLGSIVSGKVQGIDRRTGIYTYEVRPDVELNTAADRKKSENYAFYLGTSTAPVNGGYSLSAGYKGFSLHLLILHPRESGQRGAKPCQLRPPDRTYPGVSSHIRERPVSQLPQCQVGCRPPLDCGPSCHGRLSPHHRCLRRRPGAGQLHDYPEFHHLCLDDGERLLLQAELPDAELQLRRQVDEAYPAHLAERVVHPKQPLHTDELLGHRPRDTGRGLSHPAHLHDGSICRILN